jgi:hypothetical protein
MALHPYCELFTNVTRQVHTGFIFRKQNPTKNARTAAETLPCMVCDIQTHRGINHNANEHHLSGFLGFNGPLYFRNIAA